MPPLTLEGETLGEKHKNFNKLVKDTLTDKQFTLTEINGDDGDIHNLLKIDNACKTKNVDYILKVLKCNDMLYVSKAIKQSTWLITDQEYAHIVNPEYLHTELFPHMLTKAIHKFLLHIRLNLKDEKRTESFYTYLKDTNSDAHKWLLHCSIAFTEKVMEDFNEIPLPLFQRLCRRSVKFLQYHKQVDMQNTWCTFSKVLFLLKSNTEEYLNALDTVDSYSLPDFDKKHTDIIMQKCPERILDNFVRYKGSVDLATVVKYIKKEDIKDFLIKNVKKEGMGSFLQMFENLKHFIKKMPSDERFDFVKKVFIEKDETHLDQCKDAAMYSECCGAANSIFTSSKSSYHWYQYAPFNIAFAEIKKSIRAESSPNERTAMLSILITCARKNPQHAKVLLQHYYDKHRNEPFKFKVQFVNNIISNMSTHEFDNETWNILDKLFHSLEVYIESGNDVQLCLKAIILYKVIHNEPIPEIVEKKFVSLDKIKKIRNKLNVEQQEKVFAYLFNYLFTKIQTAKIATETDLDKVITLLEDLIKLLVDWKKDLNDYPQVRQEIQKILKIKKDNSWQTNLLSLYNINKASRRYLFDESVVLCPSEDVCLNVLKHEPRLLTRHSDELDTLRTDDGVSLRRLLAKIRIYWPNSLAQQWTDAYMNNMNKTTGRAALIKGLFVLLPQEKVLDIAKKHVPKDTKIEWSEVDQNELSICKNVAKSLYLARPLTPLDAVLWYAKGDYLQFAVPSLNALIHNISKTQSRDYMSKLLEAPISLQKFGLHLAFIKLQHEDLKPVFTDIWKATKNSTIRTHIFVYTFNLICKVKEPAIAKDLWELLKMFIENLGADDNKTIFNKLSSAKKVHISVQGEFFMKSYVFLTSLPASANCENYIDNLLNHASSIMHLLDADFVADKILAPVEEKMIKNKSYHLEIMATFVLHGDSEEEQCKRFRKVMQPALEYAFTSWNLLKDGEYAVRHSVDTIIRTLTWNVRKFLALKKIVVPVQLFMEIQKLMEQKLSVIDNYARFTSWKLTTDYVKLVVEHKDLFCDPKLDKLTLAEFGNGWLPNEGENVWEDLHTKLSPKMGKIITKLLKEDTQKYFPTICWLFTFALNKMFENLSFQKSLMKMETLKYMIVDEDFIPSYLVVCDEMPRYGDEGDKAKRQEVRKILLAHPSTEVKMHYERAFEQCSDLDF